MQIDWSCQPLLLALHDLSVIFCCMVTVCILTCMDIFCSVHTSSRGSLNANLSFIKRLAQFQAEVVTDRSSKRSMEFTHAACPSCFMSFGAMPTQQGIAASWASHSLSHSLLISNMCCKNLGACCLVIDTPQIHHLRSTRSCLRPSAVHNSALPPVLQRCQGFEQRLAASRTYVWLHFRFGSHTAVCSWLKRQRSPALTVDMVGLLEFSQNFLKGSNKRPQWFQTQVDRPSSRKGEVRKKQ